MKTFLRYFVLLAAIVMAGIFATSCDKDSDASYESGNIYGKWEQINDAGTRIKVVFNKDTSGSVTYTHTNGDSRVENFTFDYHRDNRILKVLETSCQLCGEYEVSVSSKRIELLGYNYYVGENVWYVFNRI
jgi:hypothetical protein